MNQIQGCDPQNTVLIFDFDGTICDSFLESVKVMNELAPRYGYKSIPLEQAEHLKTLGFQQFLKVLGLPAYKVPIVLHAGRKIMRERMPGLKPITGLFPILNILRDNGFEMGILTSNSKANVEAFLRAHDFNNFSFIHAYTNIFGKGRGLKKLKTHPLYRNKTLIYIGDEVRDITACHEAKIPIIAVTWGFNAPSLLTPTNPAALIESPQDLFQLIATNNNSRGNT